MKREWLGIFLASVLTGCGTGATTCNVWTGGTACDTCANQMCCAESQACANVPSCAACVNDPASCADNAMFNAAVNCIRTRCASPCAPPGMTGGGGGTIDCRSISCSSGAECGLACGNYCKPTGTCGRD